MSLFGSSSLYSSMLDPRIFGAYSAYYDEYLAELAEQAEQETNTITENPTPTTITEDDYLLQEENDDVIIDYLNLPEGSVLVNDLITIQNGYITIDLNDIINAIDTGSLIISHPVIVLPVGEDIQFLNAGTINGQNISILVYDENNTTITITTEDGSSYSIDTHYITQEQITEVQNHVTTDNGATNYSATEQFYQISSVVVSVSPWDFNEYANNKDS